MFVYFLFSKIILPKKLCLHDFCLLVRIYLSFLAIFWLISIDYATGVECTIRSITYFAFAVEDHVKVVDCATSIVGDYVIVGKKNNYIGKFDTLISRR